MRPAAYLRRRAELAALAAGLDAPPVDIEYLAAEHATWQHVSAALRGPWDRHAATPLLDARQRLSLPTARIPQLADVTAAVRPLTGFEYRAVDGVVPGATFFGALADRRFCSTQYIRWSGDPTYTPEPDIVHEVVGHAHALAVPQLAELHVLAGRAARRVDTPEAISAIGRVFWFSAEFGVVREPGERGPWVAYGAGLLSSPGELDWFADHAEIRPIDVGEMLTTPYDIDHYQPILFGADDLDHVLDVVGGWFDAVTDDRVAALAA